jgi:hypothetical protein
MPILFLHIPIDRIGMSSTHFTSQELQHVLQLSFGKFPFRADDIPEWYGTLQNTQANTWFFYSPYTHLKFGHV